MEENTTFIENLKNDIKTSLTPTKSGLIDAMQVITILPMYANLLPYNIPTAIRLFKEVKQMPDEWTYENFYTNQLRGLSFFNSYYSIIF